MKNKNSIQSNENNKPGSQKHLNKKKHHNDIPQQQNGEDVEEKSTEIAPGIKQDANQKGKATTHQAQKSNAAGVKDSADRAQDRKPEPPNIGDDPSEEEKKIPRMKTH